MIHNGRWKAGNTCPGVMTSHLSWATFDFFPSTHLRHLNVIVLYNCFVSVMFPLLKVVILFIAFRDLPLSILIGIPLVTCCYVLVNIAYLAVLTPAEIKLSSAVAVVSSSNLKPHLHFAVHNEEKPVSSRFDHISSCGRISPEAEIEFLSLQ